LVVRRLALAAVAGLLANAAGLRAAAAAEPAAAGEPKAESACIDEELKADLDAKRRRRSVKERLVQKTNRHELMVRGGHYVSDLFDATWVAGGAYAYHLTEDFAVEASGAYTRLQSAGGPELERIFSVLEGRERRQLLFATNLVFSPLHAKLESGSSIAHFDVSVTLGAGVVDSALASGVAGNGGIGFAFFIGHAVILRLDVRDYVFRQQLLGNKVIVNDLAATVGVGLMLPLSE
jgi:outer membrane beta-barrel protein